MATLTFHSNSLYSNDYIKSGIKDLRKDFTGKPQLLSLLSSFLERCVRTNERILETSLQIKDVVTAFHGLKAPSLTIQQYMDRIYKYSCCSPSCFVIALVYVDRFSQQQNLCLTSLNVHRLLITSVMVAAKFMDDAFFNNAYYAKVGGISTRELNRLETTFLFGLDFRLYVDVNTFEKYRSKLKREASERVIEYSIQACGVEENCANKDESTTTTTTCVRSVTR